MPLPGDLHEHADVAVALADVLQQDLGGDPALTVGAAAGSVVEIFGDTAYRGVTLGFSIEGRDGHLTLIACEAFALRLEQAASDELLLTSATPPLEAAAQKLAELAALEVEMDHPREVDQPTLASLLGAPGIVVFPIVEGDTAVAGLVIAIAAEPSQPAAASVAVLPASAPTVLADVEMGVTAELGRTEMTVRELLSLTPGAVIDLDRAAGAPVDVLVNGTLIARGEVVVIEEEFGIRISEILKTAATA